jgi:hypothetical protein
LPEGLGGERPALTGRVRWTGPAAAEQAFSLVEAANRRGTT